MRKIRNRKKDLKKLYVLAIAIVAFMGVGYALLQATLNINGTMTSSGEWNIFIKSISVKPNSILGMAEEASSPTNNGTTANFHVYLKSPGDSIKYSVTVRNGGNIDAYLEDIIKNFNNESTGIQFNVYEIGEGQILRASTEQTFTVEIKWPISDTSMPTNKVRNMSLQLAYSQRMAPVITELPTLRTTGSSSTQYLGHALTKADVESITIVDSKTVPAGAIDSWGVATGSDANAIMAYTMDSDSDSKYELYIGGDGGVKANADSEALFYEFTNATSITGLNNLYTDNVTDMTNMFNGCSSLISLDLSNFNTASVTDMYRMFYHCSGLTSLNLSSFNTSSVKRMEYMFSGCNSLTSIDLSSFNTSSVKRMEYMFSSCNSLTSIDLSNFNTSSVINMSYMFRNCSSLTSLNLSSFNTSSVTRTEYMFDGCSNLTSLDLSNFNTASVTDMEYMFSGCNSLTSLDLSNFNTASVTNMNRMFNGCVELVSLNLSSFDTSLVTDMGGMFNSCIKLTTLGTNNFTVNASTTTSMFNNCQKLTTTINITTTSATYNSMFGGAATQSGTGITVNYTSANSSLVDSMIATKSSSSNVVKGSLITT